MTPFDEPGAETPLGSFYFGKILELKSDESLQLTETGTSTDILWQTHFRSEIPPPPRRLNGNFLKT